MNERLEVTVSDLFLVMREINSANILKINYLR
jgi:hypothetical protein